MIYDVLMFETSALETGPSGWCNDGTNEGRVSLGAVLFSSIVKSCLFNSVNDYLEIIRIAG